MYFFRQMRFIVLLLAAMLLAGCMFGNGALKKQRARNSRDLGEAYMAEGKYTRALRAFLNAYSLNPDDPFLNNDLGLVYLSKGDPEKAVFHFRKAISINPEFSPARNNLGTAYIALNEWDKAIDCFMKVKDDLLYATPYYPLCNLGYVYFVKKDYARAEKYYRQALDLEPDFPKALDGLGQVYLATGEYGKAIRMFKKAIAKVPTAAPIYMHLARAYEAGHEYDRAMDAYKKAAAVGKDTPLADKAEAAMEALRGKW